MMRPFSGRMSTQTQSEQCSRRQDVGADAIAELYPRATSSTPRHPPPGSRYLFGQSVAAVYDRRPFGSPKISAFGGACVTTENDCCWNGRAKRPAEPLACILPTRRLAGDGSPYPAAQTHEGMISTPTGSKDCRSFVSRRIPAVADRRYRVVSDFETASNHLVSPRVTEAIAHPPKGQP